MRPSLALELGLKSVRACTFAVLLKVHTEQMLPASIRLKTSFHRTASGAL